MYQYIGSVLSVLKWKKTNKHAGLKDIFCTALDWITLVTLIMSNLGLMYTVKTMHLHLIINVIYSRFSKMYILRCFIVRVFYFQKHLMWNISVVALKPLNGKCLQLRLVFSRFGLNSDGWSDRCGTTGLESLGHGCHVKPDIQPQRDPFLIRSVSKLWPLTTLNAFSRDDTVARKESAGEITVLLSEINTDSWVKQLNRNASYCCWTDAISNVHQQERAPTSKNTQVFPYLWLFCLTWYTIVDLRFIDHWFSSLPLLHRTVQRNQTERLL